MERRKRVGWISAIFSAINIAWAVISTTISVANLPADASDAWTAVVSAPALIPYGLAITSLVVLAWAIFWPSGTGEISETTSNEEVVYHEELARLRAVERARKAMLVHRIIDGNLGSALGEFEKDQKAEAEARRLRLVREASEPPRPRADAWMPLHSALRYLVYESDWGHKQAKPGSIAAFDKLVGMEFRERLARGEVRARGTKGTGFSNPENPTEIIPPSYWHNGTIQPLAEIEMGDADRAGAWATDSSYTYRRIVISSEDLASTWPRATSTSLSRLASFVEPRREAFEVSKLAEAQRTRKRRERLIAEGRSLVASYDGDIGQHSQRQALESLPAYLALRKHLSQRFLDYTVHDAIHIDPKHPGPLMMRAFASELDRLETEWGLDG